MMAFDDLKMFAVSPPGLEKVVADELTGIGVTRVDSVPGGVEFSGNLETLYRANLWLRVAGRVLVRIEQFFVVHLAKLHKKAGAIEWGRYLDPEMPIHVSATCRKSRIYHSKAAAERVAKGIAETLGLEKTPRFSDGGPSEEGDVHQVLVRIERDHCTISLDSSGEHLHRRGYRTESVAAPLRENLAAAMLFLARWRPGESLVDPMCGSGTIPIEAALLAANVAPGMNRRFAFMDWPGGDPAIWERLVDEAEGLVRTPISPIRGFDIDAEAVWFARRNAERAGVSEVVSFERTPLEALPAQGGTGLLLSNPPYGKRIGERKKLRGVYAALGQAFERQTSEWRLGLITSDLHFAAATGLEFASVSAPFPNGGLRVKLYLTGDELSTGGPTSVKTLSDGL